jgi:hypothetical protein
LKRIEEEKMTLELYVAIDDHKIKMDAMRLKIRKFRKYAIASETCITMLLDQLLP